MNECPTCNNQIQYRRTLEKEYMGVGVWERKKDMLPYCGYCEWKGTTGLGAQLKEAIKEINK